MSRHLKTVKDFEKIAEALEDSQSRQYNVRSFGYCTRCNSAAEYEFSGSLEGIGEECLKCGAAQSGPLGSLKSRLILSGDMVPVAFKAEIDVLHSRERQREFFLELLEKRIADQGTGLKEMRKCLSLAIRQRKSLLSLQERVAN